MAATTTILRNADSIADAVAGAVEAVNDVHGRVRRSRDAFRDGVLDPLTDGRGWSGQGYEDASTVLGSNETALTTTLFRLEQAASAYGGLHDALRTVAGWWKEMQVNLDLATYAVADDGTVTVLPGVTLGSDQPSAEALTGQLRKILGYLDTRDRACAAALNHLATAGLPVVSSRATPGLEARAQQALHAALGDVPHPTTSWDPHWTLPGNFGAMSLADWSAALGGYANCTSVTGSGYVTGPDGRRYPIAVPVMYVDGVGYTHGDGVDSRGGLDTGWQTVGVVTGPADIGEPAPGIAKGAIILGALAGAQYPTNPHDVGMTDGLRFDENGYPTGTTGDGNPSAMTTPPSGGSNEYTIVGTDGKGKPTVTTYSAPGMPGSRGIAMATNALEGANAAVHVDDKLHYTYRAEFQQNVDGRTRVQLTAYQVTHDGDAGTPTVHPYDVRVDGDGRMQLTPARLYTHGEAARSGDGLAVDTGRPDR